MEQSLIRRLLRIAGKILGAAVLVLLLYLLLAPTGRYLVRAAWEEARILARRQRNRLSPRATRLAAGSVDPALCDANEG